MCDWFERGRGPGNTNHKVPVFTRGVWKYTETRKKSKFKDEYLVQEYVWKNYWEILFVGGLSRKELGNREIE